MRAVDLEDLLAHADGDTSVSWSAMRYRPRRGLVPDPDPAVAEWAAGIAGAEVASVGDQS